jgi:hypothetical protein
MMAAVNTETPSSSPEPHLVETPSPEPPSESGLSTLLDPWRDDRGQAKNSAEQFELSLEGLANICRALAAGDNDALGSTSGAEDAEGGTWHATKKGVLRRSGRMGLVKQAHLKKSAVRCLNGATRFHCHRAPTISIGDYLVRLRKYFHCSDVCFITSLAHIDRIVNRHPDFLISCHSIHRLLAISAMVSAKFLEDVYFSNAHYAKVCGLSLEELNELELTFLKLLDWKLDVSPDECAEYGRIVQSQESQRA